MIEESKLRRRIRNVVIVFTIGLLLSGITAFPIETQLAIAYENISWFPKYVQSWISAVYLAVKDTNQHYPYLAYGTDWLAFAHIVISINFLGPLKDPIKNVWVIQFGIIACIAVFPLAFIAGAVRNIPFYWRIIDCSFGVFGGLLLWYCLKQIEKLERITCIALYPSANTRL